MENIAILALVPLAAILVAVLSRGQTTVHEIPSYWPLYLRQHGVDCAEKK